MINFLFTSATIIRSIRPLVAWKTKIYSQFRLFLIVIEHQLNLFPSNGQLKF